MQVYSIMSIGCVSVGPSYKRSPRGSCTIPPRKTTCRVYKIGPPASPSNPFVAWFPGRTLDRPKRTRSGQCCHRHRPKTRAFSQFFWFFSSIVSKPVRSRSDPFEPVPTRTKTHQYYAIDPYPFKRRSKGVQKPFATRSRLRLYYAFDPFADRPPNGPYQAPPRSLWPEFVPEPPIPATFLGPTGPKPAAGYWCYTQNPLFAMMFSLFLYTYIFCIYIYMIEDKVDDL